MPIEMSEEMMPGVVSIPHGWGHDRLGVQLDVAQQHAGESINDVTDNLTIDALCGTAAFNGTWVAVDATNGSSSSPKPRRGSTSPTEAEPQFHNNPVQGKVEPLRTERGKPQ